MLNTGAGDGGGGGKELGVSCPLGAFVLCKSIKLDRYFKESNLFNDTVNGEHNGTLS